MGYVLVVDDEPMIRSMMEQTLTSMGFSVKEASSVAEAVTMFEDEGFRFDALVTDYELGDGTGLEIMQSIKSRLENTPVILMTGSMKITRSDSFRHGFSGYFHKPFSCIELGKKLNRLLKKSRGAELEAGS